MSQLESQNNLRKLLRAIVISPQADQLGAMLSQTDLGSYFTPSQAFFLLDQSQKSAKLWDLHSAARESLFNELVPQHIAGVDLEQALRDLIIEVAGDRHRFNNGAQLRARIAELAGIWKPSLRPHEVIYRINGLIMAGEPITIGSTSFFVASEDWLHERGIRGQGPSKLAGAVVAQVVVQASNHECAYETGLRTVIPAIDVLRLAAVSSNYAGLSDDLFLWQLSGGWAAKDLSVRGKTMTGWRRQFIPLVVDQAPAIRRALSKHPQLELLGAGTLPDDMSQRLRWASEWISTAVTRDDFDHKILDLCTALEVMLLPGYYGRAKGEVIALRYRMLLSMGLNPHAVLSFYNKRSDIVHGSKLHIASFSDYWHLLEVCLSVLMALIQRCSEHPQLRTLLRLISEHVDTPENREQIRYLLDDGVFEEPHRQRLLEVLSKMSGTGMKAAPESEATDETRTE